MQVINYIPYHWENMIQWNWLIKEDELTKRCVLPETLLMANPAQVCRKSEQRGSNLQPYFE